MLAISYEYVNIRHIQLAYKKIGNGSKKMLLFHGYGQDCHCWANFPENLQQEYTFFSFDLPFHGKSNYDFSDNSIKNNLEIAFNTFFEKNNIINFSVLGFSLGARLALFCAEKFPQNIQHIYLLAPDGIKNNFWFDLATRFWFSKMLFKAFLANQSSFIRFGEVLSKIGLLDKSMLNFVINQTNSTEKLQKTYNTWRFFAKIPTISAKKILENKIFKQKCLFIFLAKNDIFITQKDIKKNLQNVDFQIITLDCNHFKLPLLLEDILTFQIVTNQNTK